MIAFLFVLTFAPAVNAGWGNWLTSLADAPTSEPTFTSAETSCLDTIEWCRDPHNFMYPDCGSWVEGDTPAPTTADFDPTTCQDLYNMIDQNDCILQAFRSTDAPCAGVPVPEYNTHSLNVLEASVACKRFSMAQLECVSFFSVHDPTLDDVNAAVDCILKKAGQHEYKHNKDAQLCLKTPEPSTVANTKAETNDEPTSRPTLSGMVQKEPTSRPTLSGMVHKEPTSLPTLSGMVLKPKFGSTTHGGGSNNINIHAGNNPVDCTSWFCPCSTTTCRGRRLLTGGSSGNTIEKQNDQIPFIPMMAAATIPKDATCIDVIEWCCDPANFMVKDCPNLSTAKDFDPHTCQNLYTYLGQNDCIVRAFHGQMDEDPCAHVKLPYGDFDEAAIEFDAASVACENFSFANGLCVDEFSKLNPTDEEWVDAFKCIFDAAKQPKFAEDDDAKECLKFKAMLNLGL